MYLTENKRQSHGKISLFILPFTIVACGGSTNENVIIEKEIDSIVEVSSAFTTVEFEASDGLLVSGNLYETGNEGSESIVLCHQATFNKFEYDGVAERLVELGFNCLAIDQRSGGPIGSYQNETTLRALEQDKGIDYLDAIPDITAGVNYLSDKFQQPVILWGSIYSSTLVLYEAAKNENVKAVVSFSPGDYFADTLGSLVPIYADFQKPFFLTSASWESEQTSAIIAGKELIGGQVQFIPEKSGHHGSRALWLNQIGGEEYWNAIEEWLSQF